MSRQRDQRSEEMQARADQALVRAIEYTIPAGMEAQGLTLLGLSVRIDEYETLITVKAGGEGGRVVAFVGSATLADALRKLGRESRDNNLRWRKDSYQ